MWLTAHHPEKPSQQLKAGARWRNHGRILVIGLLSLASSDTFLIQSTLTCSGVTRRTVGWVNFYQLAIKKMFPRYAQGNLMETVEVRTPPPGMSRFVSK